MVARVKNFTLPQERQDEAVAIVCWFDRDQEPLFLRDRAMVPSSEDGVVLSQNTDYVHEIVRGAKLFNITHIP
jgi:hypothetical protein